MSQPIKTTFTIAKTGSINSIKMKLKIEEAVDKINGKPSSLLFLIGILYNACIQVIYIGFLLILFAVIVVSNIIKQILCKQLGLGVSKLGMYKILHNK